MSADLQPPYSIEAEQSILGGLLLDNQAWERVADILAESDFYRDDHRRIFRHIGKLLEKNRPADMVTVFDSIEQSEDKDKTGGIAYLGSLAQNTPSAHNTRRYAEIVRERAQRREIAAIGRRLHDKASAPGADVLALQREAEKQLTAIMPLTRNGDPETAEWPTLDQSALHGLAGDIVRAIEPHSESDPAAILVQVLLAFGVHVGRGPHVAVEGDQHHGNLFALLVGNTSKGRKGTSWGRVRELFQRMPAWVTVVSGLSSGEGLKWNVRDPVEGKCEKDSGDPGTTDKRLLVVESEFAQALRATARIGNTLSSTVREAWDTGNLRTLTKNDPIVATNAHIAIIGHITVTELRSELTETDRGNGFANRFLFVCVKRSKVLPFGGGSIDDGDLRTLVERLTRATALAQQHGGAVTMTPAARAVWIRIYPALSEGLDGLLGAVTGRAEAQCVRLALLYALLDSKIEIDEPHLLAAVALWEYCEQSARFIFGSAIGNQVADEILRALRSTGSLTRTDISKLFKGHQPAEKINVALNLLKQRNLAHVEIQPTSGRSVEFWRAGVAKEAKKAKKAPDVPSHTDLNSLDSHISHCETAISPEGSEQVEVDV